jgi:hypothetical protein
MVARRTLQAHKKAIRANGWPPALNFRNGRLTPLLAFGLAVLSISEIPHSGKEMRLAAKPRGAMPGVMTYP